LTPKLKSVGLGVVGWLVGCPVGKKVVAQTPLHKLSQAHISTPVSSQPSQQWIQSQRLLRNASDPRVVTEFGKVTALVNPEQPRNALIPIEVTDGGMVRDPLRPEQPRNA
jgi:hypothetical protein